MSAESYSFPGLDARMLDSDSLAPIGPRSGFPLLGPTSVFLAPERAGWLTAHPCPSRRAVLG